MEFDNLRSKLKPLTFSVGKDPEVTEPKLKKYLQFYSIDFAIEFDVTHRVGIIAAAGFKIVTHYWNFDDARGTVFIFHGHFDHVGLFSHIIRWCLKEHYNVVAIDFPGHGLSSGKRASIVSFDQYGEILNTLVSLCRGPLQSPFFCIAQGAGTAAVMNMMWKHGKRPFAKMVFLSPLVRTQDWSKWRLRYQLARIFLRTVKRRFVAFSGNEEFNLFIKSRDPLQSKRAPVQWITAMRRWENAFPSFPREIVNPLVMQGDKDVIMDWRYNVKQVRAHFPNGKTYLLAKAHHHLANEAVGIRARLLQQIKVYFDPQDSL
jgi:lysophospholipase